MTEADLVLWLLSRGGAPNPRKIEDPELKALAEELEDLDERTAAVVDKMAVRAKALGALAPPTYPE